MKRIYEINRYVLEFTEMKVALIFGQIIYKNKKRIVDDKLTIDIANLIREDTDIKNKIKINDIYVRNNVLKVEIIEFPIKPDNTVTHESYFDKEKQKWYLVIESEECE